MNLKTCSLLAVFLFAIHVIDDFAHERIPMIEAAWLTPVIAIWLFATLGHINQRRNLVLVLIGSQFGLLATILHVIEPTKSAGIVFVANLVLLAASSLATFVLSILRLWAMKSRR